MIRVPITGRDIGRAKKAREQLDRVRGPGYDAHDQNGFTPRWKGSLVELAYQRELKRLGIEFVAGEPDLVIGDWEINVKHVAIPDWCRVDYRYIRHPAGNAYAFGRFEAKGPHIELYGWLPAGLYRTCGIFVAAGEETEKHAPYKLDGIELDASKLWELEALHA